MRILANTPLLTTQTNSSVVPTTGYNLDFAQGYSISAEWTNSTPSAKTFDSGVAEVVTITCPAENGVKEVNTITCPAENGVKEVFTIACVAAASITNVTYFTFSSALNAVNYYAWYRKNGAGTDPAPASKTGIMIDILTGDTNAQVATKTASAINAVTGFSAPAPGAALVTVTLAKTGATTDAADFNVGGTFAILVTTQGVTSFLNSKYFTINSALDAIAYYCWFSTNGEGVDPAPVGKTAIPVTTAIGDSAHVVALSVAAALDALPAFVASAPGAAIITCTNLNTGATTDAANVNVGTGFTTTVATAGVTSVLNSKYFNISTALDGILHYVWFSTNSEGVDPAPVGRIGIPVTTAISDSANTVADSVAAALDALPGYVAPNPAAAVITCTNASTGVTTNAVNVTVGAGFSVANSVEGVTTEISLTGDSVSIPAHGYTVGLKGRLTSTGTLPAGVTTSTDYFVIPLTTSTIQFASSRANAIAGTAIDLTDDGAGVHTFTGTVGSAGTIKLQASNDDVTYTDVPNSSVTISATGNDLWNITEARYKFVRVYVDITTGQLTLDARICVRGLNL